MLHLAASHDEKADSKPFVADGNLRIFVNNTAIGEETTKNFLLLGEGSFKRSLADRSSAFLILKFRVYWMPTT